MSLCSYADTLSMLSLIWVDIISLFIYTQDALQELLYYVLFDTEQLILCSSTIKGKIFLKLFQSFLRILFFSGLLFYKQDEEEVTVQWGIFFSSHNFFPHAGLHFNKDSQIQSAEELHPLFISLWSWQKKMKTQRIHSQWASYFWLFIKKSAQILWHNTKSRPVALRDSLSGELSQHITNPSYRIQRAK